MPAPALFPHPCCTQTPSPDTSAAVGAHPEKMPAGVEDVRGRAALCHAGRRLPQPPHRSAAGRSVQYDGVVNTRREMYVPCGLEGVSVNICSKLGHHTP